MTNKFLILCTLVLAFQISGCTSSQSQDENQTVENADVAQMEAEDAAALGGDAELTDSAQNDPSVQAALGEQTSSDTPSLDASADALAANDTIANEVAAAPTLDESSLNEMPADTNIAANSMETPPPMDIGAMNLTENTAPEPMTESPVMDSAPPMMADNSALTETPIIENSGTNEAMAPAATEVAEVPVKKSVSEKKISAAVPYQAKTGWVNAVYIARPNETIKEISQKIYSADHVKELKQIAGNSYLKNRSVRAGDKIYYVSPNRPDDSSKTLFYYEDMGMVPETYVAKKGDNLKKVAKEILGYDKAYVELWAANPVESKTKLSEGETIRYWKSASGVTSNVAMNSNMPNGSAQLIDQNQMPPPPPTMDPSASMPPPPDQSMAAANQPMPELPPPPPEATASLPPPPPPPEGDMAPPALDESASMAAGNGKMKKQIASEEEVSETSGGLDDDTMMSLAAVGILMVALVFVLIRRKKKKATETAAMMNETHVGM